MTTIVTNLTIDARGSTAGAAEHARAMRSAEGATRSLTESEARAAQARNRETVSLQKYADNVKRVSADYQRLRATTDQVFAAQVRGQQEVERAARIADAAVQRGLATQREAARVVDQVRVKQEALVKAAREAQQAQARGPGFAANDNRSIDAQTSAFAGLTTRALAATAALVGVAYAAKTAATGIATAGDEVRTLTTRMNVLTGASQGSKTAFDAVFAVAQRTGSSLDDVAGGFSKLAIAAANFGATTPEIAKVTETLAKLARVGGATAQETSSAIQQLGQALSSGVLQGDELRSIRENAPLVAQAIAREFGVTSGELKKLGEEGRLTADRVFKALVNAGQDADRQFKQLTPTLEQAGTRGANAFKVLFAAIDETFGVSKLLAGGLDATAERATTLAARIRGDINVALADTIAKINELQGTADRLRKEAAAGAPDKPPGVPDSWVPDGRRPGQSLGITGRLTDRPQGTSLTAIERQIAEEQDRLLRQRQEASSLADSEMQERDRESRVAAQAKADSDARRRKEGDKIVADTIGTYDKAVDKVNKLKDKEKELQKAVDAGSISKEKAAEILKRYGASLDAASGAAKDTAQSVKALAEATIEAETAQRKADAAYKGGGAIAQIEAEAEAAKKALEVFDKRNAAFEKKYADQLLTKRNAELTGSFRESTVELERSNKVLEAQLRLVNERPEVIAKEIAALKVRNEIEEKGLKLSQEDIDRRIKAAEVAELYTLKIEEAKKQQEAMAEPFKNAIQSLQSYIVDGLTGGFENAGQAIKGMWKRLMAELAVATVIRPVIVQPVVSVLGGLGLVPQSVVGQYGGGAIGGGLFGGSGVGGVGDLLGLGRLGMGSGGGMFGLDFGAPLFGSFAGMSPGSMAGVIPGMSGADALNYAAGLTGSPTLSLGGLLGGVGSLGMGIMGLARGNTIGGGAGILGGAMGLVGGLVPSLSFLGPIGMGLGLIGGLLGSLFKKKPKTPQAVTDISFGADGWMTSEAMRRGQQDLTGGTSKAGGSLGKALDSITSAYGLSMLQGAMGGYLLNSIGKNTGNQWIIGLGSYGDAKMGVNGARELQSGIGSAEDAVDMLAAAIFARNAQTGHIGGLTGTQQAIFRGPATFESIEEITKALDFSKVYDDLARGSENVTAAEKAVRDLNDQFRSLSNTAKQYGLDVGIIEQRRQEAINKMATDINEDYRRRLVGQGPAGELRLQIEDLQKARDTALKEAGYLNSGVSGVGVNVAQIQQFYREEFAGMGRTANDNVRRGLLAINDPNALAREDLVKAQEARMAEAQAINAVTPGLIDFNQLIALNNAELKALEKTLVGANDNIRGALDRLRFGGESSPYTLAQQQQNALREYQSLEAAAIRGDAGLDKDRLIATADQLLSLSKERFDISAGYTDLATRVERLFAWMLDPTQPIPKFAAGGMAQPGWALLGEQGPELVRFPMAAQVYSNPTTMGLLGGGDPELRREVAALREQVAVLSRQLTALTAVTAEVGKATRDTAETNRDMASEARSQNNRDKARGAASGRKAA